MVVVSHARLRVWAARRTLPWLIGLASLAMVVSAWCWQFALGTGTHQHPLPAAAVAAACLDDTAPAAAAAPADRDADAASDSTVDSTPDGADALVGPVAPLADQPTMAGTPATQVATCGDAADLAVTGPRAPPQPAA